MHKSHKQYQDKNVCKHRFLSDACKARASQDVFTLCTP